MHVVFSSSTENGVQACPHMDFLSYFFRLLLNSRFGLWLILYVFIFCYFLVLFLLHFSFLLG